MLRTLISLLCLVSCLGATACVSQGSGGPDRFSVEEGSPGRVTLRDYRSQNELTLVNEAHTDPLEAYTEKRSNASTKVTSNEVFRAMLEYFDDQGWSGFSRSGRAPLVGTGSMRWALEVESPTGTVQHVAVSLETPKGTMEPAIECKLGFMQIFDITQQSQAIDNAGGGALFEQQQRELQQQMREQMKKSGQR